MNRKLYYNNKFIEFPSEFDFQSSHNQSFKFHDTLELEKHLKLILDDFIYEDDKKPIIINNISFEKAFAFMQKYFHYIEAAGGFIKKDNKYLFIRRHNKWDLPKGKLEKGETIEQAAVRECEEECQVKNLKIVKQLSSTFHIYKYKKGYALKQAYWFYMQTDYVQKLIPQSEEDITEVDWFDLDTIEKKLLKDSYYTIIDVAKEGLKIQ
jgi:ADP-ribose pyrophosphatase YjhB (NUDIX family)